MSRYFVTTSVGLETVLANEIQALGGTDIEIGRGGVYFDGDKRLMYKANLWLRTGNRVLIPLKEFAAKNAKMLYSQIFRMKWEDYFSPRTTFVVNCTFGGGQHLSEDLKHSHFVALKIKDAIVDRLREKFGGERPSISKDDADIRINAYCIGGRMILSLDSSGASLHERGYRVKSTKAPMKENLAAALVMLTEWDGNSTFVDPMCGSGTIAIEAAMIARNQAPGLTRRDGYGFMRWRDFDRKLWAELLTEAQESLKPVKKILVFGYDKSKGALSSAMANAEAAGVEKVIKFEPIAFENLKLPGLKGTLLLNPPYGERLDEDEDIGAAYKSIGDKFKKDCAGWTAFVFTGNLEAAKSLGLRTSRRIELFNGAIECRLLKYDLYEGSKKKSKSEASV